MSSKLTFTCLVLLWSLSATPASATGLYELFGSSGAALPFSSRVVAADTSVVYFNPALMTRLNPGLGISFMGLAQQLDIGYGQRTSGLDISSDIYRARLMTDAGTIRLSYRPLATEDIRMARGSSDPDALSGYITIGTVQHLVPRRLSVGLHATLPLSDFQYQQSFFPDQREQYFSNSLHFELLGDRTRVSVISLALAWRPLDWFSVGAGLTMTTRGSVTSEVYVADVSYQETAEISARLGIDLAFVPHFSLAFEPLSDLIISTSLHLPYESRVNGESELQMWNYPYEEGKDSLVQTFEFTYGYEPLRAALGAAWSTQVGTGVEVTMAGWARYARWSEYSNRLGERPRDEWSDTVSGNVGVQLGLAGHRIGLDAGFVPSPVPEQTGMDNYVDNHRLVGALGWSMPLTLADQTLRIGASFQAHYLLPRSHTKDLNARNPVFDEFDDSAVDLETNETLASAAGLQTNNPGYPGFDHRGWLLSAGLHLKTSF